MKVKLYNTKYKLCLCQSATPITINTQSQLPSTLQFSYLDKEIAVALEMLPNSVSVDFTLYKKKARKTLRITTLLTIFDIMALVGLQKKINVKDRRTSPHR